jgi:hypothetical protein
VAALPFDPTTGLSPLAQGLTTRQAFCSDYPEVIDTATARP